jgi:hypothetical protein
MGRLETNAQAKDTARHPKTLDIDVKRGENTAVPTANAEPTIPPANPALLMNHFLEVVWIGMRWVLTVAIAMTRP